MKNETNDEIGFSDLVNIDNHIFLVGSKDGDNKNDAFILKCDLDLDYLGESSYTSSHKSRYNIIIVDKDNNIVVIGSIYTDSDDGIIAKYDYNLELKDIIKYGDDEDDYFTDIIESNNGYLVSGYSTYRNNYLYKFIKYSDTLKLLEANQWKLL